MRLGNSHCQEKVPEIPTSTITLSAEAWDLERDLERSTSDFLTCNITTLKREGRVDQYTKKIGTCTQKNPALRLLRCAPHSAASSFCAGAPCGHVGEHALLFRRPWLRRSHAAGAWANARNGISQGWFNWNSKLLMMFRSYFIDF